MRYMRYVRWWYSGVSSKCLVEQGRGRIACDKKAFGLSPPYQVCSGESTRLGTLHVSFVSVHNPKASKRAIHFIGCTDCELTD
jgi:hypothetical protein